MGAIALTDVAELARDPGADVATTRIIEATARCLGRWGVAKTTVDDVAREAGVSRATVYRYIDGGKDHLVLAVGIYEEGRFYAQLGPLLDDAGSLLEVLARTVSEASRFLQGHPVLATLVQLEPEKVLPYLAFDRIGPLLYRTTAFLTPYLEPYLPARDIPAVAEWATRLVLSMWLAPSERVDPTTIEGATHIVERYLLAGLTSSPSATPTPSTASTPSAADVPIIDLTD